MNIVKLQDIKLTHRSPFHSYTLTMRKQKEKLRKQFHSTLLFHSFLFVFVLFACFCLTLPYLLSKHCITVVWCLLLILEISQVLYFQIFNLFCFLIFFALVLNLYVLHSLKLSHSSSYVCCFHSFSFEFQFLKFLLTYLPQH